MYQSNKSNAINEDDDDALSDPAPATFTDLHVPWQYRKLTQGENADEPPIDDEESERYLTYDSISCIAIEIAYNKYTKFKEKKKDVDTNLCPSTVDFATGCSINFDKMIENRQEDNSVYRIKRVIMNNASDSSDREDVLRPMGSPRFFAPENFTLKDPNGKNLKSDAYAWIVKKFVENKGMTITKRELREGLIKEIMAHE